MATLAEGILGPIRGKISNTVGMKRGNKNYLRIKGVRTKPVTDAQVAQQYRFKETMQMMRRFVSVFRLGFVPTSSTLNYLNVAMKMNSQALLGDYPNLVWDFSQIVLSIGNQTGLSVSVLMDSTQANVIDFTWYDNASDDIASLTSDNVNLVFFSEEKGQIIVKKNAAVRGDLNVSIVLPQALSGSTIHVWAFVVGATSKQASTSEYIGSITLA